MTTPISMQAMAQAARLASRSIGTASTATKNQAIESIADELHTSSAQLVEANDIDLDIARSKGIAQPLIDRLILDQKAIDRMCEAAYAVAALPDPVGSLSDFQYQPSGIQVGRMRIPLGVIGMIYESRPNVTVEAASLCIKSGNACILRGGSESINSNIAIADRIDEALIASGLPNAGVQVVRSPDRSLVSELLQQNEYVDLIVPRGGKSLIERVASESTIPVLKHLDGVCHVYIDESADVEMAIAIAVNSKAEKFAVCNAAETLLVARTEASRVLPKIAEQLQQLNVELRGCARSKQIVNSMALATEEDWYAEYLGPKLAVRLVDNLDEAVGHINTYGSGHTDVIVSSNYPRTQRFLTEVDSATVMVNASTQFADGFEFGLGAEIGISTDKLHARGPVGLEGLTTQKFVVLGKGEIRHR